MLTQQELLAIAAQKTGRLKPGTQVRLTADVKSYWLFNFFGQVYIGSYVEGYYKDEYEMPVFFPGKQVYEMRDKNDQVMAHLQKIN